MVASGVRMDIAQRSPSTWSSWRATTWAAISRSRLEHTDPEVLRRMKKPEVNDYEGFADAFRDASATAGKPRQYLVPYFIASHPGSDLDAMIDLALFLKRNGYRPDQVQDFIPAPFDVATCMYYTGLDPFTGEEVYTRGIYATASSSVPCFNSSSPRITSRCARALQRRGGRS